MDKLAKIVSILYAIVITLGWLVVVLGMYMTFRIKSDGMVFIILLSASILLGLAVLYWRR